MRTRPGLMACLAVTAIAYSVMHHIGFGLAWLGTVGGTRWVDWIDIGTPYAVLLPAAMALYAGDAGRATWALYLVGAITYVEGHGIHLAANSVGNDAPGEVAHLWDEVVGHYLWYAGVFLVFAALARVLLRTSVTPGTPAYLLAAITGVTVATNALEGGTALMCIGVAAAFLAWARRAGPGPGRLILAAAVPALVLLLAYGLWQRGFPQPTEIGLL
ncbi:hypothetical protein [Thermomonospora umbrina]|uniref:Uncharacterized protein n=1 Tax=Thermomonospora umbrina TaxID=111806 RepID=A0A3D9SIT9_9ACTN|nr:hypothetical protein [Thermomonospora umbrina]REE95822.1 hypothetical protein DFJ69_1235 [Thermomonospora umbrina]